MRKRTTSSFILVASLMLGVAGCPDPEGQFFGFKERFDAIGPVGNADLCAAATPDPMMQSGEYFFSLSPTDSPDQPAPFLADVQTDGSTLTFTLTPVSAEDRTTVVQMTAEGDPVMPQTFGPFDLANGVATDVELVDAFVPGDANPISGNNLTVQATLQLAFCADDTDLLCGTFDAQVTAPFSLPLAGTFAFQRIQGGMNPEPPILDCDGRLAAPL